MTSEKKKAANRRNWANWRGVSQKGCERQRQAALRNRPWEHSTGPRTERGKAASRANAAIVGVHSKLMEPFASARRVIESYQQCSAPLALDDACPDKFEFCSSLEILAAYEALYRVLGANPPAGDITAFEPLREQLEHGLGERGLVLALKILQAKLEAQERIRSAWLGLATSLICQALRASAQPNPHAPPEPHSARNQSRVKQRSGMRK